MAKHIDAYLVALAAGIFLGAAFLDALPAAARGIGYPQAIIWMGVGFLLWWLQKKILHRFKKPELSPLVATALWFHSALEGIVTGLAFGVSQSFGFLVFGGMLLHLLPEFFAAMTLMRGSGSTNRTSVAVTFLGYFVLFASFGLTYHFLPSLGDALPLAIALSGGALLYIGAVSYWRRRGRGTLVPFLLGIGIALLQAVFLEF